MDERDRLFVATLVVTIVVTMLFSGALAWDIAQSRNGGGQQTTSLVSGSGQAGQPTDQGGDQTTVPEATPSAQSAAGSHSAPAPVTGARVSGAAKVAPANAGIVAQGAPILIGALVTMSGPLDASDAFRAEEAYVQWVNSQGGINGHKLNLDVKDDQGNPAVGRPAFEQIVQEDHAFAIVGECGPVTDATIVDEINNDQIPVVNDCLTSARAYTSPYIWFSVPAPNVWQATSAAYLYKHQSQIKIRKPYMLCVNSTVTLPYCDGFLHQWTALGGTTYCNGSSTNCYQQMQIATSRAQYESVATQIRSSGADSIVAELEPTNELAFLQALQDQGMNPQQWAQYAPLGMDPATIRTVGSFANGIYVSTGDNYYPSENTPGIQQLRQVLATYFPDTPADNYALAIGWAPCVIFGEALRRMGSNISRQSLIDTLNNMRGFDTQLTRPLEWTASNHQAPAYTRWAQVTGEASYNVFTGWVDANGNPAS
jgi:branched-chain amino acid transport system substrate-binding protein